MSEPVWVPLGAAGLVPQGALVTALPASPVDGQEVVLVDSLTAPTYSWALRYVASITDANKWVFVGGSPAFSEVVTEQSTGSSTFVALATAGPSLTCPRAGEYLVEIGFECGTEGAQRIMSYDIGATGAVDADGVTAYHASGLRFELMRPRQKTIAAAGTALVAKYRSPNSVSGGYGKRWMRLTPIRLA